jgi:hypothetical protein
MTVPRKWNKTSVALTLGFVAALSLGATAGVALTTSCSFRLGFAELHDLIPDVVGDCTDDESHDPQTGDALQHTTTGLLVWRKSDNWTAFTDGFRSWVDGPLGLQKRLNAQRLWWEANPEHLTIVPTPRPGERCHTAGLDLSLVGTDAGAGNFVGTFRFSNTLDMDCSFFGYPGAQLLDGAGNPLPTNVVRGGGYFVSAPPPSLVDVPAHDAAIFRIHWEQVPVGNETTCAEARRLAVTPPDEYVVLVLPIRIRACGGGHLDVTAILPNEPVSP